MKYLFTTILLVVALQLSVAPPVTKEKVENDHENEVQNKEELADIMEYHRYLMEVVQALESDPEFQAKLEKAEEADIRSGKIAHELEFVSHKVRSRLDELKREELIRLKQLAAKQHNLSNGLDLEHLKIAEHVDHSNRRTFEIEDLKKLFAKTTKDLAEADQRRRKEFKEYEMQKKFEEEQRLKSLNEEERRKYEEELKLTKQKQSNHDTVNHPVSKQQLEEVWENTDHMDKESFEPRTFFMMHDIDSNGLWDQDEVKALFIKELDKLYAAGAADVVERAEEMERMREHVFSEADINKDGFISYEEFIEQTKRPDFQQDEGWEGLEKQQIFSEQEYQAFERKRQEEIQKLIAQGMFPPKYANVDPHGQLPANGQPAAQQQQQFHGQPALQQQQYYHIDQAQQEQLHHQMLQQRQGHYQGQVPQQQHQQYQPQQQQQQQQVHNQVLHQQPINPSVQNQQHHVQQQNTQNFQGEPQQHSQIDAQHQNEKAQIQQNALPNVVKV
ncbi:nucleobindin-2 isoform X2 [Prorops nasuta]|uniref:nucleobindin-2 isoform X2 n=1 Tax=Prorops nasuta TaxID=863751 RepID=UPI0034CF3D89